MDEQGEIAYPMRQKKSYKKPIVLGLMALGMVGIVWGLLSYYGIVTASTTVTQSLEITQPSPPTFSGSAVGGSNVDHLLQVTNNNPSSPVNGNLGAVEVSIPSGAIWGTDIVVSFYSTWTGSACSGSLLSNPISFAANSSVNYCVREAYASGAVPGVYNFNVTLTP